MPLPAEKQSSRLMRAMFSTVAPRYDFITRTFSYGMDRRWKLAGLDNVRLPECPLVLDLAAGSGVWGIVLAKKSPQVRVTAVDWPDVLKVTRKVAERHGVAERFTFAAGDLLQANFGSGHQVATLGHILHSEGESRSRELIKKTFDALAPGGSLVAAEDAPGAASSADDGALAGRSAVTVTIVTSPVGHCPTAAENSDSTELSVA